MQDSSSLLGSGSGALQAALELASAFSFLSVLFEITVVSLLHSEQERTGAPVTQAMTLLPLLLSGDPREVSSSSVCLLRECQGPGESKVEYGGSFP